SPCRGTTRAVIAWLTVPMVVVWRPDLTTSMRRFGTRQPVASYSHCAATPVVFTASHSAQTACGSRQAAMTGPCGFGTHHRLWIEPIQQAWAVGEIRNERESCAHTSPECIPAASSP